MNFKKPYLFIYDTGEIDTFKDTKSIMKKLEPKNFATGKLFKIIGDGNYKDLMIVDTMNGICAYTDLQEALEAQADYGAETIEEFIEEKEADVDILTHPEKYSDTDVVQEVMKAFDFVGNEGTEKFVKFLKVEPVSNDVQEELQEYMDKGLEEVKFKELAEERLEDFKVKLDNYFGDKIKAVVYGNPLLRVTNPQFVDNYTDLRIFANPDNTFTAIPVNKSISKEQRKVKTPEDVSNFMEDLTSLAEEQRQEDESWENFEQNIKKELESVCYQKGATEVDVAILDTDNVDVAVSAYRDDKFMFGYLIEDEGDRLNLKKEEGYQYVLIKTYNKMSYPEAVELLKDYIKDLPVNTSSKRKQTRLGKVLSKIENSMSKSTGKAPYNFSQDARVNSIRDWRTVFNIRFGGATLNNGEDTELELLFHETPEGEDKFLINIIDSVTGANLNDRAFGNLRNLLGVIIDEDDVDDALALLSIKNFIKTRLKLRAKNSFLTLVRREENDTPQLRFEGMKRK